MIDLFPRDKVIGVFSGFSEGGLEFHANLVLPYSSDLQNIPMHGQFMLVQLETANEAVLGRITSFSSDGRLSHGAGEEFNIRAVRDNRPVPEDIREQYLKYRVNIRVLGVLRVDGDGLVFVPSHRRLPHVGSPIAFPSDDVLREIAGHNDVGATIGFFALGEYVYTNNSGLIDLDNRYQVRSPEILVKFPVENLVARRSFVFARAGFGKSNLNKLLFTMLYKDNPTVEKRGKRRVPVGTIIFDRDGEYFWPDDKGRPGLCDVPHLQDKIAVFTNRKAPSGFYGSFVAGNIKLDLRRLRPTDVIGIAVSQDKHEQQNIRKLRGMNQNDWSMLVELIHKHGNDAALDEIRRLLKLEGQQEVEALAARANMTTIVRGYHDPSSQLMDKLLRALADGKICIVDISQLLGGHALVLSAIILKRIFDRNQEEFTAAEPNTIPVIAVMEEAQSVLSGSFSSGVEPFITWVKEGRKYDLGALMITQQPGSIPTEILSQGDNWFVFHLLSAVDLNSVKSANAHFSSDILSSLLNEPIPGQGVFWSSVGGRAYPLAIRVLSFEATINTLDVHYNKPPISTYASRMKQEFILGTGPATEEREDGGPQGEAETDGTIDVMEKYKRDAVEALRMDDAFMRDIEERGIPWGRVKSLIVEVLPESVDDRQQLAYNLIVPVINIILGPKDQGWHSYKSDKGSSYMRKGPKEGE